MTINVVLLTVIQTSYKFLFHSIVNAKWEISWIYFQLFETWAIPSNRQFGGHRHWNIFDYTQSLCLFFKISDSTGSLFSNICDFYRLSLREASQKSLTLWKHSQNITALTFLIGAEGTYTFLWPWYATPGPLYSRHRKTQFHLRCPPLTDPLPFCRHHYSDNIICTHILSRCVAIQNFKSFKWTRSIAWRRQTSSAVFSDNFVTYLAPWDVSDIPTPPRQFATQPPPHFLSVSSFWFWTRIIWCNEHATNNQETTSPSNKLLGKSGLGNLCPRTQWRPTESACLYNISDV